MCKIICICLLFGCWLSPFAFSQTKSAGVRPVKIILDTDIGPDYDDAGALAFLHAMADSGRAEILGTIACNKDSLVVPTIEVINTYFGRPSIPTGTPKSAGVSLGASQHWPDSIVARFPHRSRSSREAPDAVLQYRKILAGQPDGSVTIVTIGFLTNLHNLLLSGADGYSPLNGRDLVARKVLKLVSMAGRFPSGKEFNVYMDAAASGYCYKNWPTPIIFTGFEIGEKILTGLRLVSHAGRNNPVREAFRIAMAATKEDRKGRMSWDETAILIAVYGTKPFFTTVEGTISINPDGTNGWKDGPAGKHSYVKFSWSPEKIGIFMEDRMMK